MNPEVLRKRANDRWHIWKEAIGEYLRAKADGEDGKVLCTLRAKERAASKAWSAAIHEVDANDLELEGENDVGAIDEQ